jgi:hypothetical protein
MVDKRYEETKNNTNGNEFQQTNNTLKPEMLYRKPVIDKLI